MKNNVEKNIGKVPEIEVSTGLKKATRYSFYPETKERFGKMLSSFKEEIAGVPMDIYGEREWLIMTEMEYIKLHYKLLGKGECHLNLSKKIDNMVWIYAIGREALYQRQAESIVKRKTREKVRVSL